MNNTYQDLIREIDRVVWNDESDIAKVHAIQGLLYQWDQIQDHKTQQLFDWSSLKTLSETYEDMWKHDCPAEGESMFVGKGEYCNYCGAREENIK